ANQPISQSANQPISQSANHLIGQPLSQQVSLATRTCSGNPQHAPMRGPGLRRRYVTGLQDDYKLDVI
ncbi:MAG: hypothetical protein QM522_06015, partial [Chitinophagaceae bacterium]|nr:hypothetical protein [Chitinophagaceae bacterium]